MRGRVVGLAASAAVVGIALGGCGSSASSGASTSATTGGSGSGSGSGGRSGTLTVGLAEAANGLNPISAAPPDYIYYAYDPLIYETSQGAFISDLATSWGFVGSGNKTFELHLRHGAHFSDGSLMTSADVSKSLLYFAHTKGQNETNAGPVATVVPAGKWAVKIEYKAPQPERDVVQSLTQDFAFGDIIGPKGLAHPSTLTASTDGVGPYEISGSQTVAGSTYTYVPDPHYFNQAAIRYQKVVVKPYTDPNAELAAIRSGQIDYAQNLAAGEVGAAKSAGLSVSEGVGNDQMLMLEDRTSGPLAKTTVRRALGYAIDRAGVVKTVDSGLATPQVEVGVSGYAGYDPADASTYTTDLAKAKSMLAAAGYPHGFTLTIVDAGALDKNGLLAATLASSFKQIGVTVKLTVNNGSFGSFIGALASKKYDATVFPPRAQDIYATASTTLLPPMGIGNVFGLTDPTVNKLMTTAATASTQAAQDAAMVQVTHRLDQLAWFLPIALDHSNQVTTTTVKGVPSSFRTVDLDPVAPVTSLGWHS